MLTAGPYAEVARALASTPFHAIRYLEDTESTNADAAALLGDAHDGGTTIVAEYQRRGSGRKGRSWQAVAGASLLFSTVLPRAIATDELWIVPFWAALAVRAGLRACSVPAVLQWPNDLLLGGRKLAGVLCQSSVTGATARVACGVGINVLRWEEAAATISPAPAFCDDATAVGRGAILQAVLTAFHRSLAALDRPDRVIAQWDAAAELPGHRYRIEPDNGAPAFEAVGQGLARGGGLEVRLGDGTRTAISLADVRVLR